MNKWDDLGVPLFLETPMWMVYFPLCLGLVVIYLHLGSLYIVNVHNT